MAGVPEAAEAGPDSPPPLPLDCHPPASPAVSSIPTVKLYYQSTSKMPRHASFSRCTLRVCQACHLEYPSSPCSAQLECVSSRYYCWTVAESWENSSCFSDKPAVGTADGRADERFFASDLSLGKPRRPARTPCSPRSSPPRWRTRPRCSPRAPSPSPLRTSSWCEPSGLSFRRGMTLDWFPL